MLLSWNEIQKRAIEFSKEWENESSERAGSHTFWNEFFNVFGLSRKRVASFEVPVKKLGNKRGFIDLFWKGILLVEHKSRGEDLESAYEQGLDYFPGIAEDELPKYVLVSDFANFKLYDLEMSEQAEFKLEDLYKNIHLFDFIGGFKKHVIADEAPVNIEAAILMGKLHDSLKESGFTGHKLEVFLVRVMFCLFADDTGVFQKDHFSYYIESKTKADGSDTGLHISAIFQTLNIPESERQITIDEDLMKFPYVNGGLFDEQLPIPSFNSSMRRILLECCHFDWSSVSPAIFGSLFQSAMDPEKRRELGAHYTSEKNILKVIRPLFLDELTETLSKSRSSERKLRDLKDKISKLTFLDPACGSGTFLIIAYRELRKLELEIWKLLRKFSENQTQMTLDIELDKGIDVDSFYGIELEEFPAQIAQVALWLVDHQMNIELSTELGIYYTRLPLRKSAHITIGDALELEWNYIVARNKLSYILGNPPYAGKQDRSEEQRRALSLVVGKDLKGSGVLDYVAAWFIKAARYIQNSNIRVAFVSTNAISHGEQVSVLWSYLSKQKIKIHFAHRTFEWSNEARSNAGVYVIIIGFGAFDIPSKRLFDYITPQSDAIEIKASNINPYLVDMPDLLIHSRSKPICGVPNISFGSMPNDDGNFLLSEEERGKLLEDDPGVGEFIKELVGGKEFLNGTRKWCIWLRDVTPEKVKQHKAIVSRIDKVKAHRDSSEREATKKLAKTPTLFGEIRQPSEDYILIPLTSSERRDYIPMKILSKDVIVNNTCAVVLTSSLYHFGVLMSSMHMAWVRHVCGRLTGRFRYSNNIVYNNFPWPKTLDKNKMKEVEQKASKIQEIRDSYRQVAIGDLYDPLLTPKDLRKAHNELDRAVEKCYRSTPFVKEIDRVKHLFKLYMEYTNEGQTKELEDYFSDDS